MRIGGVSNLNTKPLHYGIERTAIRKDIDMIIDYPDRALEQRFIYNISQPVTAGQSV